MSFCSSNIHHKLRSRIERNRVKNSSFRDKNISLFAESSLPDRSVVRKRQCHFKEAIYVRIYDHELNGNALRIHLLITRTS